MKSKLLKPQKNAGWVPAEEVRVGDTLVEPGLVFKVKKVHRENDELIVVGPRTVRRYSPEDEVNVHRHTALIKLPPAPADFPQFVVNTVDNVNTKDLYSVMVILNNGRPERQDLSHLESDMIALQKSNPDRAAWIYRQLKSFANSTRQKAAATSPRILATMTREEAIQARTNAHAEGKHKNTGWDQSVQHMPEGEYVLVDMPLRYIDFIRQDPIRECEYADRVGDLPPVSLSYSAWAAKKGKSTMFPNDGNHRCSAAQIRGTASIHAITPREDFERFLLHLQRLSNASSQKSAANGVYEQWLGVDLDGTLAVALEDYSDITLIGPPVPLMVEKVRRALAAGMIVKVFTARMADANADKVAEAIARWTELHVGTALGATNVKDPGMVRQWDDKARGVEENTGRAKYAMKINVPESEFDHFWEEPPAGNEEFWAFRFPPKAKPGDQVIFHMNKKPVAEATISRIEKPGEHSCEQTGRFKNRHKVYWAPESFTTVGEKTASQVTGKVHLPRLGDITIKERNTMYFAFFEGVNVATASLSDDGTYLVSITVPTEYQRMGIATAMYDFIEKHIGHPLRRSPNYQSPEAKNFWKSREKA